MRALIDRQLLPDSPVSRLEGEIKSLRGRAPRSRRSELELEIDRKRRARDALDREIAELEASLRSLKGGDPWGQEDHRQTETAATDG